MNSVIAKFLPDFLVGLLAGEVSSLSYSTIIVFILSFILPPLFWLRAKQSNQNKISEESVLEKAPVDNFKSQLGDPNFEPEIENITFGHNPFFAGAALQAGSPLFYGRDAELRRIENVLFHSDNTGSVSIVAEDKMGKSSLLNTIYLKLARREQTISVITTMSDWQFDSQPAFFAHLHRAICQALSVSSNPAIGDYEPLRDFIHDYAKQNYYFVLLVDEFDRMLKHECFDNQFFSNMRALADNPHYHFSFVLASREHLDNICQKNKAVGSKFWNIFTQSTLNRLPETVSHQWLTDMFSQTLETSEDLETHLTEILQLSGCHPLFIQLVAREYWEAMSQNKIVQKHLIEHELLPHYRTLWRHRSLDERAILERVAQGKTVQKSRLVVDLQQRGLLTNNQQLFSVSFQQFLIDKYYEG